MGQEYGYCMGKVQVQGLDTRSTREVPMRVLPVFSLEERNMKNRIFGVFSMFFAYTTGPVGLKIPTKSLGCSLQCSRQLPSSHGDDPTDIQSARN